MFPINVLNIVAAENEERLEEIRIFNEERRFMRAEADPFSMTDRTFKDTFRLNKDLANYVLERVLPNLNETANPVAVPVNLRFFAALYFYATGSYQRLIGQSYEVSVSQSVVSRAISEVTDSITNNLAEEWIRFPRTAAEKNEIKGRFMEMTGFPGVIGAIDGTHVAIIAPEEEEHNYVNRKGYHSKNIQLICTYDLKILNVNARYPGSTHDAFIWRHSFVRAELQRLYNAGDRNSWLLGDSGYPQQPWLMIPFPNAQEDTPEANYNYVHVQARNCIERCNGLLKGRFRCCLKERVLRYAPDKAGNIVNACAILHNICVQANLEFDLDIPEEDEFPDDDDIDVNNDDINVVREGHQARRNLIQAYFRN